MQDSIRSRFLFWISLIWAVAAAIVGSLNLTPLFMRELDWDSAIFIPGLIEHGYAMPNHIHPAISLAFIPMRVLMSWGLEPMHAMQCNFLLFFLAGLYAAGLVARNLCGSWTGAFFAVGALALFPAIQVVTATFSDKVFSRTLVLIAFAFLTRPRSAEGESLRAKILLGLVAFSFGFVISVSLSIWIPFLAFFVLWRAIFDFNLKWRGLVGLGLECILVMIASVAAMTVLNDLYTHVPVGSTLQKIPEAFVFAREFAGTNPINMLNIRKQVFFFGITEASIGLTQLQGVTGLAMIVYTLAQSPLHAWIGRLILAVAIGLPAYAFLASAKRKDYRACTYSLGFLASFLLMSWTLYSFQDLQVFERWEFLPILAFFFPKEEIRSRVNSLRYASPAMAIAYAALLFWFTFQNPTYSSIFAQLSRTRPSQNYSRYIFSESELAVTGDSVQAYLAGYRPLQIIETANDGPPLLKPIQLFRPLWLIPGSSHTYSQIVEEERKGIAWCSPGVRKQIPLKSLPQ